VKFVLPGTPASESDFPDIEPMEDEKDNLKVECLTPDDLIKTQLKSIEEVNTIFEVVGYLCYFVFVLC
jgi:hypothetical protein